MRRRPPFRKALTSLGGAINNCVHIARHTDRSRLFVCNNDETIKVFDLPSMNHFCTLRASTAVNGVSVSPDGTKMISIGDSDNVALYNVTWNGSYEKVGTLATTKDAGFSCAWDKSSTKFAVGCQDGFVCVWDIRSAKKLAQLPSCQANGRGAVRSVKFSQSGSVDLLAFTEVRRTAPPAYPVSIACANDAPLRPSLAHVILQRRRCAHL